ncbi:MAG: hypothetical protein AAGA06_12820 [Pseudomonadota bacterium]
MADLETGLKRIEGGASALFKGDYLTAIANFASREMRWTALAFAVLAVATFLLPAPVAAQDPTKDTTPSVTPDPYGRASPPGTVNGYLKAMREAALFLDRRGVPDAEGARRAKQLKELLDSSGYFFLTDDISASPEGNLTDEMSADPEEVGALRVRRLEVPLILQRVAVAGGRFVWLFSHKTLNEIQHLIERAAESPPDALLPNELKKTTVLTVPTGHWLAILAVAALSLCVSLMLGRLVLQVADWAMSPGRSKTSAYALPRSGPWPAHAYRPQWQLRRHAD